MKEIDVLVSRLKWIQYAERLATRVGLYLANYNAYLNCRLGHHSTVPLEEDENFWLELSLVVGSAEATSSSDGSTMDVTPGSVLVN